MGTGHRSKEVGNIRAKETGMRIRPVTIDDAAAIAAIYAPFVTDTAISFEVIPPDGAEMARRIADLLPAYPYLVAEDARQLVGYACASPHRARAAYVSSVDVAIYVAPGASGRGIGRMLYAELLPAAAARGYHAAFAGIALPNVASIRLHEAVGFMPVGIYHEVGYKLGRWHDVGWWQRLL